VKLWDLSQGSSPKQPLHQLDCLVSVFLVIYKHGTTNSRMLVTTVNCMIAMALVLKFI